MIASTKVPSYESTSRSIIQYSCTFSMYVAMYESTEVYTSVLRKYDKAIPPPRLRVSALHFVASAREKYSYLRNIYCARCVWEAVTNTIKNIYLSKSTYTYAEQNAGFQPR
jgi:hypothetical protein